MKQFILLFTILLAVACGSPATDETVKTPQTDSVYHDNPFVQDSTIIQYYGQIRPHSTERLLLSFGTINPEFITGEIVEIPPIIGKFEVRSVTVSLHVVTYMFMPYIEH